MRKIAIGCDHAGLEMKKFIMEKLPETEFVDCGTKTSESVDYPDFAAAVCKAIQQGDAEIGILVCGTGIGVSMAANRYHGIRAAHVESMFTAKMAKEHNDANILCLGERVSGFAHGLEMIKTWLNAEFGGAGADAGAVARHRRRIEKIHAPEKA